MADPQMGHGETTYMRPMLSRKQIMVNNFIGGIFWALGSVVGLSIIVTLVGVGLKQLHLNLIVGDWLSNVIQDAFTKVQPK
ncbi:hypothetical protein HY024_00335 [Candidatus Curtissbacteria bacterium]|nr:hypothetical protein [Candidatus Curtissbacteria bacterium]